MEADIICISSDGETNSQKEKKKKRSTIKPRNNHRTSILCNIDLSSDNEEEIQENGLKRKISQKCQGDKFDNLRKKLKTRLSRNKNTPAMDKDNATTSHSNSQVNGDQKVMIKKPNLIAQEQKNISYTANASFDAFVSVCLVKEDESDMKIIVDKLKTCYNKLDSGFATSENFTLFLNDKREAIVGNDNKLYVHIQEVMAEMKKRIKKQSQVSRNKKTGDAVPSTSFTTNNLSVTKVEVAKSENDDQSTDEEEESRETYAKIKSLTRAMRSCEIKIKKLEEAEVDFDDEGDSNYIRVERYKERMVELYKKLCQLTGENADAGRAYLRPKYISATRIIAVDHAISNFINKNISKRNQLKKVGAYTDDLIFPDYRDILECVNRCNNKRNLGLDKRKQEEMAKTAFIELGEYLQRARRNDYWDTFSLYLENREEDPALKNNDLAYKLANNHSEGKKRLAAVFEKYAKKQEETKEQLLVNDESGTEDENEESSVDDEDKDDISVDSVSASNVSEEDRIEIEEDKSEQKQEKNNTSMINVDQGMEEVTNKAKTDTSQVECNKGIEMTFVKESSIPGNKEKTADERICRPATDTTIVTARIDTDITAQEDELPSSTTNCTSTVNGTEEDVAGVVTEDVPEEVTNPATVPEANIEEEVITEPLEEMITDVLANVVTEDKKEMVTENVTKVPKEEATNVVTKTIAEVTSKECSIPSENQQEEKKKPVLRVRSFAKPPTTWEDGRHKAEKTAQENIQKVTNQTKDLIDLTNESNANRSTPVVTKCTLQLGNRVVPLVKSNRQTLVLPSGSNIISVQNITNNYLKVDKRTGQIIAPANDIRGPTIIQVPSTQTTTTARQNQPQSTNAVAVKGDMSQALKKTIVRIIPSKAIVMSKKSTGEVPKQTNVHLPAKQNK